MMMEKGVLSRLLKQAEVIVALRSRGNIPPMLTSLVWQKLEEQNPDFFCAYNIYLQLKEQITAFNYLVRTTSRICGKNQRPLS